MQRPYRPRLLAPDHVPFLIISYALVARMGRPPLGPRTGRPPLGPCYTRNSRQRRAVVICILPPLLNHGRRALSAMGCVLLAHGETVGHVSVSKNAQKAK